MKYFLELKYILFINHEKLLNMTNLTKLSQSLNLNILNSAEANHIKGGSRKDRLDEPLKPSKTKPAGGGAGLPPTLDMKSLSI